MNPEPWTPPKLVEWIKVELARRGVQGNLRLEAELLVAKGLGLDRMGLFLAFDRPLDEEERTQVRELVRRRLNREPLGYILGDAHFWTLVLAVGPGVLIPRADSETLVEALLELTRPTGPLRALEFGLGSGALSLAWAMERGELSIDGLEKSPEALAYAHQNLELYRSRLEAKGCRLDFRLGSNLEGFTGPYEVIFSNPPYLEAQELEGLEPEVRDFEPHLALVAEEGGLEHYRVLFAQGLRLLGPQGILVLEIGYRQKEAVVALAPSQYRLVLAKSDLGGHTRVLAFLRM
ncbi:MAG: protein-(glutamine-N5) methyltransferase, release factor-specific [Candidatus Lambdaproteobacteria bacterium RIFOXYD1_FULL_56_27]|uniref:peptide chain release factor N(5)-glutamine methyltransferase n=1 Tax=Candidatus Lambdaproteobacteria bacterium RIFOXYD2_FULL_56_26 TaxID=1817773 RepID=A0A1F6GMR9_9PROT|nr:MAG: protein-(glutamine-N5) methyltransferase, release factor-specific [Candidatus Lambdaproteobacteria bacterium RIFOXYD2_FULL_56_26]OGH05613.1 MAG: protein-(glutamine-N5) methyltransferase, release factor-specific [Candidatus Lambdaproteobacteria bacterium RIFOXYC1_FULL_56_13]OGH08573.1 MAG: protein-(glutamine-N5) methyltransferase, release factor-specific [Candidatus Lambdaproteobacteria bacterium RIFOXYD1_FULL_56_27]